MMKHIPTWPIRFIIFDKDIKDNNFDQHFDIVVGENSPSDGDGDGSSQQISMSQDIDALEEIRSFRQWITPTAAIKLVRFRVLFGV